MRTSITYLAMGALLAAAWLVPATASADRDDGGYRQQQHSLYLADRRHDSRQRVENRRRIHIEPPHGTIHRWHAVPRQRHYHGIPVYRHYGHSYPGYGFYYNDADAFPWIAFTVMTMAIVNRLDEHQQRLHEQAFVRATTANAGDTVYWQDERSSGAITVERIWYDSRGRQCRDLQQTVNTHSHRESGFSTVCLQPNGAWEVTGSQQTVIR